MERKIGIIAGTALRDLEGLDVTREGMFDTKYFGNVWVIEGTLAGKPVVVIPRHGRYHTDMPQETNFIGNLIAMKLHGVTDVIAVSAMGGLANGYDPGTLVFVDVTTDKTWGRRNTIFGDGIAGHIARPKAVCPQLHQVLVDAAVVRGISHKKTGNLVVISGPQFSSLTESHINRGEVHHVVGMNTEPEAKLARELGLCYAIIGQITDRDNPPAGDVVGSVSQPEISSHSAVVADLATKVLRNAVWNTYFSQESACGCRDSLVGSILTDPRGITPAAKERLCDIFGIKEIPKEWFAQ